MRWHIVGVGTFIILDLRPKPLFGRNLVGETPNHIKMCFRLLQKHVRKLFKTQNRFTVLVMGGGGKGWIVMEYPAYISIGTVRNLGLVI